MSQQRCVKLAKKIMECKKKHLHPKVIRRLERKLDCATARYDYPVLTTELHRVFQSARATLNTMYKIMDEVIPPSVWNKNFLENADEVVTAAVVPDNNVKHISYRELLDTTREVYIASTSLDGNFKFKALMLCGVLGMFHDYGYELMGITKETFNFDPYFFKCLRLANEIADIVKKYTEK